MRALLISLGAGVGAPSRYLVDKYLRRNAKNHIPIETLLINIIGSFILGITVHRSADIGYFFGTGFAGAFTTWSTFAIETHDLFRSKRHGVAWGYLVCTLVLGVGAAAIGNSI